MYRKKRNSYKLDLKVNEEEQIELFSFENSPKRPSYPEALGLRHLAFEVDNLDSVVEELISKEIEVEDIRIDEFTLKKFVFFKDPDNLPIELYEK